MIRFEMDVAAADMKRRTIEGVIVPYGEVGKIAGTDYRFRPGSVKLARARTPLLVDHDRSAPVGVLTELIDGDDGVLARFTVDATPDGDRALIQAASGSRGSLSVGAELDDYLEAGGGVVDVTAARVLEVSLLALGAFERAGVTRVAAGVDESGGAAENPPPPPDSTPPPDDDDDDDDDEPDPNQTELPVPDEQTPPAPPAESEDRPMEKIEAAAAPVIIAARSSSPRELTAGEFVQTLLRAQHGDHDAARMLEAALTETLSTDIPGLLPPSYESTVLGPSPVDRTLYETFKGRPLPGVGLAVQKPQWTTLPVGGWATTVDDDAHTSKAVVGLNAANVERWDWATALSYTAAKRSSPDALDSLYAAAVQQFYAAVEIKIATLLDVTAGTPNAAIKLGAGIAAFYTRTGRAPEVVAVAPDVWGVLADAGALTLPFGFSGTSVGAGEGGLSSSYAGLRIVASGALAAGTKYLATRRALDVRVSDPVQLTANAIGALNVELGVVGEGLFDADYPLETMELTTGAPVLFTAEQEAEYAAQLADMEKERKARKDA